MKGQKLGDNQQPAIATPILIKKGKSDSYLSEELLAGFPQQQWTVWSQTPHKPEENLGNDSVSLADSDTEHPGEKSGYTPIWGLGFSL